jgi:hypothetical protein
VAELDGIVGEGADVQIEVEGTVRGRHPAQAHRGQGCQEMGAVASIALDSPLQLFPVLERTERCVLGEGGRRDEQVLRQPGRGLDQILRQHEPAQAPARHAEIFREAVDDDGLVREGEDGLGWLAVGDAVIDLVRDDPDAAIPAPARQPLQLGPAQHSAGRVRGAREHEPMDRPLDALEQLGCGLEAGRERGRHRHDLDVEGLEDVAIGRIAGLGHDDAVPGVERGQEGQDEGARGTHGQRDPRRVDLPAVSAAIMLTDPSAQGRQAERLGVAPATLGQGRAGSGNSRRRSALAGLADLEMQHVGPGRGAGIGGRQHLHHDEGGDRAAARRPERQWMAHAGLRLAG